MESPWRERVALRAFAAAEAVWVASRKLGRVLLGAGRFDRLVGRTGLRELKSRIWLSRRALPDGGVVLCRPHDFCVIDEVYDRDVYGAQKILPGQTVVDAGAHIGVFALMAARRVGPAGRVLAFEPSPGTHRLLLRNLEANGLGWVAAHAVALAEREGQAELFVAAGAEENPVADTLNSIAGRVPVPVRLRRLDDVLAEVGVSSVDHLKIDVEGAELRALEGAPRTLARTRRVIMEVHPAQVDPAEVRARLEALGFSCRIALHGAAAILEAEA